MLIILLSIIFFTLLIVSIWATNFFIGIALFRRNPWYEKIGHKLVNPENSHTQENRYTETANKQKEIGNQFWESEFGENCWLKMGTSELYSRKFTPHPQSNKWVICVHGYRSYGKQDMAYVSSRFSKQGYNILVPDLRAHGKSAGEIIGMGWLDRLDLMKWIDTLITLNPQAEIILFGCSMGAATVMMTSGEPLPQNVKGLVADCGYSSVYKEFSGVLRSAFRLPPFPIMNLANWMANYRVGYKLSEASSVSQLAKNKRPALFIHGTGDTFIPHQMMYENMEATAGIKEGLLIENAPHYASFIYEPEHYFETVFEFIKRYCITE